ncbi:MAG: hypothetical protein LBG80_16845 [Bacteroidales bacterium]|jgi:hypothetical protein|nr:hypothetical protein [Bacteroidales bacterium]
MEKVKRLVDIHIMYCQSSLVKKLLLKGLLFDDYPFTTKEIMEWWLVSSWLAEKLSFNGEVVLYDYNCHWWGRQTTGQPIYIDDVMHLIANS